MHPSGMMIAVGSIFAVASIAVQAQTYTYRLSEIPASHPLAINNSGHVAGQGNPCNGCEPEAFLWTGNTQLTFLGPLSPEPTGSEFSDGRDINNLGQITGQATFSPDGVTTITRGFVWHGAQIQVLPTLAGDSSDSFSEPNSINTSGHVTGVSATVEGELHAFLWDGIEMHDLGTLGGPDSFGVGINASGDVTGSSTLPMSADGSFPNHAFLWNGTRMRDLGTLGGTLSFGSAINATRKITGTSRRTDGEVHAFLWHDGLMEDLGTLGGLHSQGEGINNPGQVVGASHAANGQSRAFLWENGVMKNLRSLVAESDPLKPHVTLLTAANVNDLGQIVALGRDTEIKERRAYLVSPSYKISSFIAPSSNSMIRESTVHVAVALLDAKGVRIPDARATLLAADPCRVKVSASGAQTLNRTCMTYDSAANEFVFNWKLGAATGATTLEVRVNYGSPGPLKTLRTKSITITN